MSHKQSFQLENTIVKQQQISIIIDYFITKYKAQVSTYFIIILNLSLRKEISANIRDWTNSIH